MCKPAPCHTMDTPPLIEESTEAAFISGVFTAAMLDSTTRQKIARAQSIMVGRAQQLREALEGESLSAKMSAQHRFDEAAVAHRNAILDVFDLEPPGH